MKLGNRILAGLLSFVILAGETLPARAADPGYTEATIEEAGLADEEPDAAEAAEVTEDTECADGEAGEDSPEGSVWLEADGTEQLIHLGGFPESDDLPDADGIGDADRDAAEDAIIEGVRNFAAEIDVSAYGIPAQGAGDYYFRVLNRHPDLFYTEGHISWSLAGNTVAVYRPSYSSEYNQSHVKKFYNKVDSIIKGMDTSWSKLEKVLYLHEYLVTHCDYQRSMPYSKYNAYNALIEGEAVCQGYSEAFEYLLQRVGVDGQLVTSKAINHAWNILKLNGEWFYIDCTWDDPLGCYGPYCGHKNFLRSASGMRETGHYSSDWTGAEDGADIDASISGSSRYDSYFWSENTYVLPQIGHLTLMICGDTGTIYDFSTGTGTDYAVQHWGFSEFGWTGEDGPVAAAEGRFFYATSDSIYTMTTKGKQRRVYSLSDSERKEGHIYGLSAEGNVIRYWVNTGGGQAFDKAYVGSYTVKPLQIPAVIRLDKNEVEFTEAGQSIKLNAEVKDEEGEIVDDVEVIFTSSDEDVVTVDENGTLKPEDAGFATVTASCEGLSASCKVKVAFSDYPGIVLSASELSLSSTKPQAQLEAMLIGENGKEDRSAQFYFITDDETVATVNGEGLVTAVYDGVTLLRVSCNEYKKNLFVDVSLTTLSAPTAEPSDRTELLYGDMIRLSTDTEGVKIRYTTDGSVPSSSSAVYSSPIVIGEADLDKELVIKAYAGATYYKDSPVAEFHYPVVDKAGIDLSTDNMTFIRTGRSRKLTVTVKDHRGDIDADAEVLYESLNPAVASVDGNGLVTACGNGETTILVKSGTLSAQCAVKVEAALCRVDFYAHEEILGSVTVNRGDCVKEIPEAEGLLAWYDTEAGELWNPLMPVLHDLRLDACFEEEAKDRRSALDPSPFMIGDALYLVKGQSVDLSKEGNCVLTEGTAFVSLSKKGVLKAKKAGEAGLTIQRAADGTEQKLTVYVADPVLNKKSCRLVPGEEEILSLRLFCGEKELTDIYPVAWVSSAPSVAMVNGGRVAALSKGSATLTAYVNGKTYKCKLTVADTKKPVLSEETAGNETKLSDVTLQPLQTYTPKLKGVSFKNREWTSDLPFRTVTKGKKTQYENGVLRIESSGKITAVGSGSCTIGFTEESGRKYTLKVSVPEPQERSLFLNVGKSSTLRFYGVKNAKAVFTSSDSNAVFVSDKGAVKAVEAGAALVTCEYEGFEFRTMVYAENWALQEEGSLQRVKQTGQYSYTLNLAPGEDFRIKIRSGEGFSGRQKVLFTSSKAAVAYADEYGVIHGEKAGKTTISTKVNGKKITIKVVVQ